MYENGKLDIQADCVGRKGHGLPTSVDPTYITIYVPIYSTRYLWPAKTLFRIEPLFVSNSILHQFSFAYRTKWVICHEVNVDIYSPRFQSLFIFNIALLLYVLYISICKEIGIVWYNSI